MFAALCLALAGGPVITALPVGGFTLSWRHSIERIEWREHYAVTPDGLLLVEAGVQGSGAGMDPGIDARFVDGWWIYHPDRPPFPRLVLSHSAYTDDYTLCADGECRPLTSFLGQAAGESGQPVELHACDRKS